MISIAKFFNGISVFFLLFFTLFAPIKFSVPFTYNISQSVPQDFLGIFFISWPAEWGFLLLIASALFYLCGRLFRQDFSLQMSWMDLCVLLWVFFVLVAFLYQGMRPASFSSCLLFFAYGLYYFLLRSLGSNSKVRDGLWLVSVLSFTLIAVYGFYQQYEGLEETLKNLNNIALSESTNPLVLSRLEGKKVFSTFVYSNTLAGYLILWIPMLIFFLRDKGKRSLFVSGALFGAGVFFLILFGMMQKYSWAWVYALHWMTLPISTPYLLALTRSKGALISLLIAGAGVFFLWISRKNQRLRLLSLLGLLLLGVWVGQSHWGASLGDKIKASWKVRVEYNQASWAMIKDHPLLGTGPGTYGAQYMHYKVPEAEEVQLAHNNFLQMASEYGVLALLAFLGLWGISFQNLLRLPWGALKIGALWALGASFIHNAMDFDWFVPGLGFFTLFFMSECTLSRETNVFKPNPMIQKSLILFGIVALLLLVLPITRLCQAMDWQEKARDRLDAGNTAEGVLCLQNSTLVYPYSSQVWIDLAEIYFAAKDFGKAEDAYQKSLELIPDHAMTWWKLAFCRMHQDQETKIIRDKEVLTALQNAINYYPTNLEIQKNLSQYQAWLKKVKG